MRSLRNRLLLWYGVRAPNHRGKWRVHGLLRELLNASVDGELVVERAGLRWSLNPSDYQQEEFFWLGAMDRWDTHHLLGILESGSVIIDVGANFGYYALTLAERLGEHCRVHAFEPNPATFEQLLRNIRLNDLGDRVTAHRLGLSDAPGTGTLIKKAGHSGAAMIRAGTGEGDVPLTSLDEFCTSLAIGPLDFLKIDVEGLEERVLRGGLRTLARHRPTLLI